MEESARETRGSGFELWVGVDRRLLNSDKFMDRSVFLSLSLSVCTSLVIHHISLCICVYFINIEEESIL